MATLDDQIREQNPWWARPGTIRDDRYLLRLRASPFQWTPPVLDAIDLKPEALHTLRGPRQVGKSTSSKLLIERLLDLGERRVLYFAFDLAREAGAIAEVIRRSKQLHPDPDGPWHLFLDEVTQVRDWQRAVKYGVDQGLIDGDFVLCTGSSAHQMGTEQLAGRRGVGKDYVQMPVSFRDFCTEAMGIDLPPSTLTAGEMVTRDGQRLVKELNLMMEVLRRAFDAYVVVGGFPAAIADYLREGQVSTETILMLWSMVAGDIQKVGRDTVAVLKLLERTGRSLGSTVSWQSLVQAMDVGSANTAREYVNLLAESFVLLVVYFWDLSDNSLNPKKQRKIYYIDPLFDAVAGVLVPGTRAASVPGVVENLMAIGLYRSATERLVQAGPLPGSLGVWKSGRGTEIDFVVAERVPGGRTPRFPVEVNGDASTDVSRARQSISRVFGRGLVATNTRLDLDDDIPAIPVPVVLAALRERPERTLFTV